MFKTHVIVERQAVLQMIVWHEKYASKAQDWLMRQFNRDGSKLMSY